VESTAQHFKAHRTVWLIIFLPLTLLITLSPSSPIAIAQGEGTENIQVWGSVGSNPGQFNNPAGIVLDPKGYVFVVDSNNDRIQKFTSNGTFVDEWGTAGAGPGQFNNPGRIALDPSGNLFVADFGNNRIQKFDENGNLITMWGTGGAGPGQFYNPTGMTVQFPQGNVFVADSGNSRIQQFDNSGKFVKEYSIGENTGDITNIDLDVDSDGKIYLTDRGLDVIKVISP